MLVGTIAIAVMDGLSEMLQLFPTINPMVEFVEAFVDPTLATCVSVSYWYLASELLSYLQAADSSIGLHIRLSWRYSLRLQLLTSDQMMRAS